MARAEGGGGGGLVGLLLLASCVACTSTGAGHTYKLYPGPSRPAEELATLRFGDGVHSLRVDGLNVERSDYESIDLLPGEHEIAWGSQFLVSVLVNPTGRDEASARVTAELLADHTYTVHGDRTTGPGYQMYLWIEDTATGEVIGGRKMP